MGSVAPFRLGLLVCGHVHPSALDLGGDYPELFAPLFGPHGIEIVPFAVDEGRLPADVDDCDGWITSPSRQSVLDDARWIAELGDFIGAVLSAERPFLGICFGHQLVAHSQGGRVERAATGWGVGVKDYEVVEQRRWMEPARPTVALVASHEDQVTELPPGATLLLRSDYCPVAGFELGDRCVTLQPHVEFTTDISRRLTDLREDLIGAERAAAARATLHRPVDREVVAGWFARFLLGD